MELLTANEIMLVDGAGRWNTCAATASGAALGAMTGAGSGWGTGGVVAGAVCGGVLGYSSTRGSSNSSGSRVICTHFYRNGMLDRDIWLADMQFTFTNLSPATVRGYHLWAIPYVRLMRKSPIAEKVMFPLAKYRAIELAHKMGVVEKGSLRGKIIRAIGEPICFMIGVMAKEQNWESLWKDSPASVTSA